ncbi:MAG: hypothetical protein CME32_16255 [Gimesia sp.]|nr:hypothetical protein [Gimesia sp.]
MNRNERTAAVRRLLDEDRIDECHDAIALSETAIEMHGEQNYDQELQLLRKALELIEKSIQAKKLYCAGLELLDEGKFEDAWQIIDEAYQLAPEDRDVRFIYFTGLLLKGRYQEGFAKYELRVGKSGCDLLYPDKPIWDRSANKTIIITGEQGRGDQIQMIRFLDWDQFRGNIYFVECHAELMPLFEKLDNVTQVFPFRDDLRYEEQIAHPPVDENEFDFQIPFMSLAHFANAEYSEQLFQGPYLVGNSQLNDWSNRLQSELLKVGIVWRGNVEQDRDKYRSIPFDLLTPLLQVPGVKYFSLTVEQAGQEELAASEHAELIENVAKYLTDYEQTAAVIENLDLVISVDTSVAHLAGAMGKEVWVPLSKSLEWRWGIEGDKTHWYPSMTLIRQTTLDQWEPVIETIASMLSSKVEENTGEK